MNVIGLYHDLDGLYRGLRPLTQDFFFLLCRRHTLGYFLCKQKVTKKLLKGAFGPLENPLRGEGR